MLQHSPTSLSILGAGWLGAAVAEASFSRFDLQISSRSEARRETLSQAATLAGGILAPRSAWEHNDARFGKDAGARPMKGAVIPQPPRPRYFTTYAINLPNLRPEDLPFFQTDALLLTIPPGRGRENVAEKYLAEVQAALKAAEKAGCQRIIYTSSSGVYGEANGWVTEESPTLPTTPSAQAVLAAEQLLWASPISVTILRLAGLYGPNRHPGRWFGGKPSIPAADAPVNLIHQADVVSAIHAVLAQPPTQTIYNVCAASHPPKGSYYAQAAADLGLDIPTPEPGGQNGKKVSSQKLRQALNWQPVYDELAVKG